MVPSDPQVCGQSRANGAITCLKGKLTRAAPPEGSVDVSFEVALTSTAVATQTPHTLPDNGAIRGSFAEPAAEVMA
jgi:hypothetical protein